MFVYNFRQKMNELTALLLIDISNGHNPSAFEEGTPEQTVENHFADVEKYLYGFTPMRTFSSYCGLESQYFPPADFFTDEELLLICNAFEKMMFSWNLGVDYPENLPIARRYKAIIQTLDMKTGIVSSGMLHFDYCTGNAPDCVWKEYCPCLQIWNSETYDHE